MEPFNNLSITLHYFNAISDEKYNQLIWETTSEYNNDYFNIEKSHDGINFKIIDQIEGSGSTNNSTQYSYFDEEERFVTTYYRLISVNYNGEKSKSEIISIKKETDKIGILAIYPNPAKNIFFIDIKTEYPQNSEIQTLNQIGHPVFTQQIFIKNTTTIQLNIEGLENGIYFVKHTDDLNKSTIKKLIIR